MHEWALAEAIVYSVNEEAARESLQEVSQVKVKVGELQQIDMDIFNLALESVLHLSKLPLDMGKMVVEIQESTLHCQICRHLWNYREALNKLPEDDVEAIHFIPEMAHIYLRCPECGSPDFNIAEEGRGVWIDSIEGVR
ncbi:MAG: hydrogenase nickel incorporation protein HypA [Peptococcaceae bacterium]|nr:hydrogenase nickel incorporation protein HypA [Peptococcaceae bacterium]